MKKRVISIILCLAMLIAGCGTIRTISSAKSKPVRLNASQKSLKLGKKYQLKVKKAKGITVKKKTFTKKGAAISVSKKGKVAAKKAGKATVICKVKYKKKGKKKIYQKTLKCKITVLDVEKKGTPAPGEASAPASSKETQKPPVEQSAIPTGTMSSEPTISVSPNVSQAPGASSAPADTSSPAATKEPDSTNAPDVTAAPTETPAAQKTEEPVKTPAPTTPPVEFSDSFALIKDMGLGINLGNTMEACGDWIDSSSVSNYETAWQKDLTTPEIVQGMRNAGFKTMRIPVAWSNMMSTDGNYTINEAYFNRVDEIIGYALDAGMYPIVNIHFDGGWWARFGSKDATERQEAMKKYKAMWTQLTEHYKEYSDRLIFESANEELGTRLNSTDDYINSGYYTSVDDLYRLTNEINQTFVDIVRASGGRNANRYLLIAGYDTGITTTCDSRFKMPQDKISDHLMVSVHYYSPADYCIAGDPNNSWGYRDSWGTDEDIKEMQADLNQLKLRFTNQGIPVIIGEYGVAAVAGSNARKEGRDLFFKNVCDYSLDHGICPVLWDIGLVYQRSTASMTNAKEAADYLELAAKAESMPVFVPEVGDGSYTWKGNLSAEGDGWNFLINDADVDNTMVLSSLGGCYALSGVDWSKYSAPKLKIEAKGLSQITIGLGVVVDDSSQYWNYIPDNEYKKTDTFQPSSEHIIDLSGLDLSGEQRLYLAVVQGGNLGERSNFNGEFTLRISD